MRYIVAEDGRRYVVERELERRRLNDDDEPFFCILCCLLVLLILLWMYSVPGPNSALNYFTGLLHGYL